jgi:uncharacterized protein with PIN domain
VQKADSNSDETKCSVCGSDINDIANFVYNNVTVSEPTYREELCKCRKCGTLFTMHYDLFDADGHIYSRVFTEDTNDPDYKWSDILSKNQLDMIIKHITKCQICKDRLETQIVNEAWFNDLMNETRGLNGLPRV